MTGVLCALAGSGADRTVDAIDWANIGPGNTPQSNAAQNPSGYGGTLTYRATMATITAGAGARAFNVYVNSVLVASLSGAALATAATVDFSVFVGQPVYYEATKGSSGTSWSTPTVTISIVETGQVLDTFSVSVTAP